MSLHHVVLRAGEGIELPFRERFDDRHEAVMDRALHPEDVYDLAVRPPVLDAVICIIRSGGGRAEDDGFGIGVSGQEQIIVLDGWASEER